MCHLLVGLETYIEMRNLEQNSVSNIYADIHLSHVLLDLCASGLNMLTAPYIEQAINNVH